MNRTIILLVITFFHCAHIHAQSNKWQLGIIGNYRSYKNTVVERNNILFRDNDYNDLNNLRSNVNIWSLGLSIERGLTNQKLFLSSGLSWARVNLSSKLRNSIGLFSSRNTFYVLTSQNDQQLVYETTERVVAYRNYLSVPLEIRYELASNKSSAFYVKGGFNTSVSIGKAGTNPDISGVDNSKYFENTHNVLVEAKALIGVCIAKSHVVNSRLEAGILAPLTNRVGDRKLGIGWSFGYILYVPLKSK